MKSAAERVDEALVGGMVWVGRSACIALIEEAVADEQARCVARIRLQGHLNPENGGTFEMLAQAIERE